MSDTRHIRILDGIKAMSETNRIYSLHRYANRIPRADSEKLIALSFECCQICTGLVRYYHGRGIYAIQIASRTPPGPAFGRGEEKGGGGGERARDGEEGRGREHEAEGGFYCFLIVLIPFMA